MFPECANPQCTASFGKLREGNLFRFRRVDTGDGSPSNSHSVQHAWLCARCCESFTLEFRNGQIVLVALVPAVPLTTLATISARKNRRGGRSMSRRRSRRSPPANLANPPVVVLAIKPSGDFPERG